MNLPRPDATEEIFEIYKRLYVADKAIDSEIVIEFMNSPIQVDFNSEAAQIKWINLFDEIQSIAANFRSDELKHEFSEQLTLRICKCRNLLDLLNLIKEQQADLASPIVDPKEFMPLYIVFYIFERFFGRNSLQFRMTREFISRYPMGMTLELAQLYAESKITGDLDQ